MSAPFLVARVEERDGFARNGITRFGLGEFKVIASLTRQRQVFEDCAAAVSFWCDMFDRKGLRGKTRLAVAVLATAICPFPNNSSLFRGNSISHKQER
jgi:hypothetical protein